MSNTGEDIKDVNKKIDEAEAAVKKYASKDTVISIGGYEFTPAKLMVAFTLVSSILGGLYGMFEMYKDYQGMKKRIAEYVAPDLTEFDKRLEVINKEMSATKSSAQESTNYANEIKNDLKQDLRRTEKVVENMERSNKDMQRDVDKSIAEAKTEMRSLQKEVDREINAIKKEVDRDMKSIKLEIDNKIKKALDNPLAN